MKGLRIVPSIVMLPLLVVTVRGAAPRTSTEIAKITSNDGIPANFSYSIAVSGDYLVVGAPAYSTQAGAGVGAVYVFHRSGSRWVQVAQLLVEDGAEYDVFGASVAIEGDVVVVGAPYIIPAVIGGGYGTVYIFRRYDRGTPTDPLDDEWYPEAKLTSPDQIRWGDEFGLSVSISGGTILVGRPGWDYSSGSAYLYRRMNNVWVHVASLNPSDSALGDAFGSAVSIDGAVTLVGANKRADHGWGTGAAYVFRSAAGIWVEEVKLIASDATERDFFAASVSIAGNYAVAGAQSDDDLGPSSGSAYVFEHGDSSWSSGTKLLASDGVANDGFGIAVSTDGNNLVVGSSGKDGIPPYPFANVGAAYLFQREAGQWLEERKLVASDPIQSAILGVSVAVQGSYAFVGAREKVYVYVLPSAAKNLRDFAIFQMCFRQEEGGWTTECEAFDLVPNGRIDLRDFDELLATLAGP
ncbi:MAG: FG-GAP repeat protein [Planctomycetota bacterium]